MSLFHVSIMPLKSHKNISLVSLTRTPRKSLENQRSNKSSIMTNTRTPTLEHRYTWDTSNRRVTLSLSSESGLEQLCQILSAMNTYGAILDNRTAALEAFASRSREKRLE